MLYAVLLLNRPVAGIKLFNLQSYTFCTCMYLCWHFHTIFCTTKMMLDSIIKLRFVTLSHFLLFFYSFTTYPLQTKHYLKIKMKNEMTTWFFFGSYNVNKRMPTHSPNRIGVQRGVSKGDHPWNSCKAIAGVAHPHGVKG